MGRLFSRMMTIASGSSGNCTYIGDDTTHVLIDAGISGKKIEEGLRLADITPKELDGIFITHEHTDHISGLGVLSRKYNIPIYATAGTVRGIQTCRSIGMIDPDLYQIIDRNEITEIGTLLMTAHPISHDAADPVCYRAETGSSAVAVATDLGCYDDGLVAFLSGLDALVLEANHDINMLQVGSYPYALKQRILGDKGHLCNEKAGELLCRILHDNLQKIRLGHLSKDNNMPQLASEAVKLEVTLGRNPYRAEDFDIRVADRSQPGDMIQIA